MLDSAQNLLQNDRYISHHTLKTLLHYLVKPQQFKNTVLKKCCFEKKFMRIYLLNILVSPNIPDLNPVNYKVWGIMQHRV